MIYASEGLLQIGWSRRGYPELILALKGTEDYFEALSLYLNINGFMDWFTMMVTSYGGIKYGDAQMIKSKHLRIFGGGPVAFG